MRCKFSRAKHCVVQSPALKLRLYSTLNHAQYFAELYSEMQQFSPQTFYVTQPYFYVSENYSRVKQELHWTKLCLDGSQTVCGYDHTQVSEVYIFRNKHLIILSLLTRHFMLLSFGKYYIQVFKVFMYFFFLLFFFISICMY